jgi:hypothetical protein
MAQKELNLEINAFDAEKGSKEGYKKAERAQI